MKKWFDKLDKGKKRIMGAGAAVAIVLLLTLGAWGVYAATSKPRDTVAKNEAMDAKGIEQKESASKKDEKEASDQKDGDESTEIKDGKDEGEKDAVKDVTESDAKEKESAGAVENANAVPQGTGTAGASAPSNPSNPTKNTTPQGNGNSNQTAAQTQGNTTQNQDAQQQNNQQQNNQQQNPPASTVPVESTSTTPAPAEQPKQEEKPEEPTKQEGKQPVWHDPVYEHRWVVDQAAWDEPVQVPIYETRSVWYCSTCNANISADPEGHLDETRHGGYWSTGEEVQVGIEDGIKHHDEVGHWDDVLVKEGYWE